MSYFENIPIYFQEKFTFLKVFCKLKKCNGVIPSHRVPERLDATQRASDKTPVCDDLEHDLIILTVFTILN